jgi:hypothetical protein
MRDTLDIGVTPSGEPCESLGENYNPSRARAEARVFKRQLIRTFGEPPWTSRIIIRNNPHDFGYYLSLEVEYNEEVEEEVEYAFRIEREMPEYWDDEAKKELKEMLP